MLALGPPGSEPTGVVWPSADIISIVAGLLLPACRVARSTTTPAEIPPADFERDAVNMVRSNGPRGPAAAGDSIGIGFDGGAAVAPVLWPPRQGACLRHCTFDHPMIAGQTFQLSLNGFPVLWMELGVRSYPVGSPTTPVDYAQTAYFVTGPDGTGVCHVGTGMSADGSKVRCSDHKTILHSVNRRSTLQLRLRTREDGARILQCQVDGRGWFPEEVNATALMAEVPCYPSLCLWAGEDGDSLVSSHAICPLLVIVGIL